VTELGQG
jgi:fused